MSAAQQAKARRRQMANGYAHLARQQRPRNKTQSRAALRAATEQFKGRKK